MTVYIITHHDFDGYACAEILKRFHKEEPVKVFYSSIKKAPKLFYDVLTEAKEDDIIYITDLRLNLTDDLKDALVGKKNNGTLPKIVIIDHHKYSEEEKRSYKEYGITFVWGRRSAAGVVYEYLKIKHGLEDPVSEEIARYADSIDLFTFESPHSEELMVIISVFGIDSVWDKISKAIFWDYDLKEKYEEAIEKIEEIYQNMLSKAKEIEVKGRRIAIFVIDKPELVSYLSKLVAERTDYDYQVYITDKLSFRHGKSKDVDLSKIASEFGGGGHYSASGAPMNLSGIEKLLLKLFGKVPQRIIEGLKTAFEKYINDNQGNEGRIGNEISERNANYIHASEGGTRQDARSDNRSLETGASNEEGGSFLHKNEREENPEGSVSGGDTKQP